MINGNLSRFLWESLFLLAIHIKIRYQSRTRDTEKEGQEEKKNRTEEKLPATSTREVRCLYVYRQWTTSLSLFFVFLASSALDGSNFSQCATDIKVSLSTRGLYQCLTPPGANDPPIPETVTYEVLYILRNHIHPDLKSEYMLEMDPLKLWDSLKQRYEQQKTIVFSEASYEWNQLRVQDFKSVDAYNHVVHNISQKLKFCEKEPSDTEKIEKTLSTMLPSEQLITQ